MLILRALPFGADSRATRWASIYASKKVQWGCWGSTDQGLGAHNILNRRPRKGLLAFALGYAAFVLASFFFAFKHLRREDVLLTMDLETALLGAFAAKLRGAQWHYDMADPFYLAKPVPAKGLWKRIEAIYIRHANIATAPLMSRFQLFFGSVPSHCRSVENVPTLSACHNQRSFLPFFGGTRQLTLGYFGTLEEHRGIENLVQFVKGQHNTRLIIGGRGALSEFVLAQARACDRIQFSGSYLPYQLPELSQEVDIYCSLYYQTKPLHSFAAPNKYFEHLALGIPILLSAGTPYAEAVVQNETGWIVEDGLTALEEWYNQIHDDVSGFEYRAEKAKSLWSEHYAGWLEQQRQFFSELQ